MVVRRLGEDEPERSRRCVRVDPYGVWRGMVRGREGGKVVAGVVLREVVAGVGRRGRGGSGDDLCGDLARTGYLVSVAADGAGGGIWRQATGICRRPPDSHRLRLGQIHIIALASNKSPLINKPLPLLLRPPPPDSPTPRLPAHPRRPLPPMSKKPSAIIFGAPSFPRPFPLSHLF